MLLIKTQTRDGLLVRLVALEALKVQRLQLGRRISP